MNIRRAEEKDIPQIEELLYQVHKVHSDKRPDLFIPGSKKYTTNELKEILADNEKPVYVADNDGVIFGICLLRLSKTLHKIKQLHKSLY